MLLAPHILVGAAIASGFANPLWGLVFAFLSHFVLDKTLHWEYSIEPLKHIKTRGIKYAAPILRRVALDITSGFILVFLAVNISYNEIPSWAWAFGGFFGILPDGLTVLFFAKRPTSVAAGDLRGAGGLLYNLLKLFFVFHQKIHYSKQNGLPPLRIGLGTQIIASLLALYFIIF